MSFSIDSISKGGRAERISQSAASQQVQELEKQLDVTLFDRTTRPLTVTPAGKLYLDYCRDVLRRHDELEIELHRLKQKISGTVRAGRHLLRRAVGDVGNRIDDFQRAFPDADCRSRICGRNGSMKRSPTTRRTWD